MAEPFSLVASSFAVVGLADVVLRAGKEFCQFLSAIEGAPTEVETLRCSINDTTLLVEDVKRYGEELKQSAASLTSSAATTRSEILLQIKSALRTLERELSALVTFAKRHRRIHNPWGRLKWVLDEQKILKALQKLEASKSTLIAALVIAGR